MAFPYYFHVVGHPLHPHPVMELIGYTLGFQLYLWFRRRSREAKPDAEQNLWLMVGAAFGAFFGSKLLAWVESWPDYLAAWRGAQGPAALAGGKTIVGGLLGGWMGVELAKKRLHYPRSTGDLFVFPLIVGMSIGRIGCFLTGLDDHTYGNYTSLPWGVNFGDGPRHPTQLYDIVVLALVGVVLKLRSEKPYENGRLFRLFILAYMLYRFCVEFIKPTYRPYLGLSAIQVTCLLAAMGCAWLLYGRRTPRGEAIQVVLS